MKRIFLFSLLLAVIVFVALPLFFMITAPGTPEEVFYYTTDIELPADAKLVDEKRDYTVGMQDSFASEGSSVLVFEIRSKDINDIVNSTPPWGEDWKRGDVPFRINPTRPEGENLFLSETGDAGNGHMLAIDADNGRLWLFSWDR